MSLGTEKLNNRSGSLKRGKQIWGWILSDEVVMTSFDKKSRLLDGIYGIQSDTHSMKSCVFYLSRQGEIFQERGWNEPWAMWRIIGSFNEKSGAQETEKKTKQLLSQNSQKYWPYI